MDVCVVMLIQSDGDDHLFVFHVDVNDDLLDYHPVCPHPYVDVYDCFPHFH